MNELIAIPILVFLAVFSVIVFRAGMIHERHRWEIKRRFTLPPRP